MIEAHLYHTPLSLKVQRPDINEQLAELIDQCLERDQANRPDINEFIAVMKDTYESLSPGNTES